MSDRMDISGTELQTAALEFGFEPTEFKLMTSGYSNQSYRLDTPKGPVLLRFFRGKTAEQASKELELIAALHAAGVKCPNAYRSVSGQWVIETDRGPVGTMEYIEGLHPEVTEDGARLAGRAMALLHQVSIPQSLIPPMPSRLQYCSKLADRLRSEADPASKAFVAAMDRVGPVLKTGAPPCLIHGDLFPDNALMMNGEFYLLDFEDAGWEPRDQDFASTFAGFCFEGDQVQPSLIEAVFQGYREITPVPAQVEEHREDLILFGPTLMMSWYLLRREKAALSGRLPTRLNERLVHHQHLVQALLGP